MDKQSDEDYVAEDEGSAPDNKKQKKGKKAAVLLNKKEMVDTATRTFLPEGVTLSHLQPLSNEEYTALLEVKDAPEFSLNYKTFLAKVSKVTDGDTIKAVIYLNAAPTRFVFRINGVDTPECRRGEAKEFGRRVKEILSAMIEGKVVKIEAGDFDKYGRILARVYSFSEGKELCINDFLVEQALGKAYFGKTKVEFTSSDEDDFLKTFKSKVWPKTTHYPLQNS